MATPAQKLQLELEQHIQDQIQQSNQELNMTAIAPNVISAIHGNVTDLLGSTVGASEPKAGVGASAPQPSVGDPYNPFGNGTIDKLVNLIENIQNNPNDPQAILNFISYLSSGNINLNDPQVQAALAGFGINGAMIKNMIFECIEFSYFNPAAGSNTPGGKSAAQNFITNLMNQLNGLPNSPLATDMKGDVAIFNLDKFDSEHYVGGQYQWVIPNPNGDGSNLTLIWNNPLDGGPGGADNFMIMELIGNAQGSGGPVIGQNPYVMNQDAFNAYMASYRVNALNTIWAQTHNPQLLIMYFMTMFDNDYQSQEGGLGNTTNLLSGMTNNYANQLLAIANQFGTAGQGGAGINANQAQSFVRYLLSVTTMMNMESQTGGPNGIASNWMTNVYNQIMNLQIPTGGQGSPTVSLGSIIHDYLQSGDASELVSALNSLNPAPNGSSPNYNPGFQAMLSALQTGGGLITGTSKMVNTQLSTVSSLDSQDIKLGSSMAAADGGGFMQMILSIINNFQSR